MLPDEDVCYVDPKHPENTAAVIAIDSDIIDALADIALPLSFTDDQLELVLTAAASLPRERRDGFLRAVAARLSAHPSDGEVREAIASALG
jgi:hypothetical protein